MIAAHFHNYVDPQNDLYYYKNSACHCCSFCNFKTSNLLGFLSFKL